ncbi:MAG: hypothetical protein F6K24_08880 [Okeania sp. SIO2D1]|nr:hypothetical protein [Okeania sp. SIO2D1]
MIPRLGPDLPNITVVYEIRSMKKNRIWKVVAAVAIALSLCINTAVLPVMAEQILPHPDPIFTGKMGLTYENSQSVKADLKLPSTFGVEDAPNILLVMLDDVGLSTV